MAIDIELSNRCNLKCKMCWFYGHSGVGDRYNGLELETSEVLNLVNQVSKHKPKIYLGGSEPFIRQDFLMILEHIKSKDLAISFATNGTLLDPQKIEMLVKLNVEDVKFSIDGQEELHDHIRGKGVFKKVTSAVEELAEYKRKMGSIKPTITVNITITADLIGQLKDTINALKNATNDGADIYRLHHLWYITSDELLEHQSCTKKLLGAEALGAASHLIPNSLLIKPEELADEILSLNSLSKVRFFPNLQYLDIIKFYSEGPGVKERCNAPFYGAVIKPDGDVRFCPDEWIDDYSIGNIRQDNFDNIWNNEKARKFRAMILWQKHFVGCKRCSWMYSF